MENVSGGGRLCEPIRCFTYSGRSQGPLAVFGRAGSLGRTWRSLFNSASVFGPQPAEGTAEPSGEEGSPPPGDGCGLPALRAGQQQISEKWGCAASNNGSAATFHFPLSTFHFPLSIFHFQFSIFNSHSGSKLCEELRAFAAGGCGPPAFGRRFAHDLPLPDGAVAAEARAGQETKPEASTIAPLFSGRSSRLAEPAGRRPPPGEGLRCSRAPSPATACRGKGDGLSLPTLHPPLPA